MLQQTQVATAIPYFEKFIEKFPNIDALAAAPLDDVLHLWSGLGYYARARNLHKAATVVVEKYNSKFPDTVDELSALPGIGASTAGAIVSIAFQKRGVILDGNVKRVLGRHYAIAGLPNETKTLERFWQLADKKHTSPTYPSLHASHHGSRRKRSVRALNRAARNAPCSTAVLHTRKVTLKTIR